MPTLNVLQQLRTTDEPEGIRMGNANVFPSPYGGGNIWDHGNAPGGEIENAGVVAVYWNPAVANSPSTSLGYSTIRNQIDAFITAFSDGVNWHDASTADYTIIQQYGTPEVSISAPLRNGGSFVDNQTTTATIDDSQIRAYLANLFTTGALTARADTVYAIFFPPGMRVNAGWGASCTQFCGYHSYTYWGFPGVQIKYAVMPYLDCSGCTYAGWSVADHLTTVLSHETREAVTDADVFSGWYDSYGHEADDKCNGVHVYQMARGGFWVQPEWSNGGTVTASGFTATYPGPGCIVPSDISTAPPAPTGLVASPGNARVRLMWNASPGATSYRIWRGTTSGGEVLEPGGLVMSGTMWVDEPLTNGQTYYFQVTASNIGGESGRSNEVAATPQAPPPAPTGLTATGGNGLVQLAWAASPGAASYNVKRGTTAGGETLLLAGLTTTNYTDTAVTNGQMYFYVVTGVTSGGESPSSNEASATPRAPVAPTVTTGVADGVTATGATLNGTVNPNGTATTASFEYGLTTSYGKTTAAQALGSGTAAVSIGGGVITWLACHTTYHFRAVASNAGGTATGDDALVTTAACGPWTRSLLWRNQATGQNAVWLMQGSEIATMASVATIDDLNWDIRGIGDFDGDGAADAIWRNTASGQNIVWLMTGSDITVAAFLPTIADTNWDIVAVGDIDGDGDADVIWRNTVTGQNIGWLMKGITVSMSAFLPTIADPTWAIAGIGDLDGDGKADLFWRNASTGRNIAWRMDGLTVAVSAFLPTIADTNWAITGLGDLDNDGKLDVIWRNRASGQNIGWLMDGLAVRLSAFLPTIADVNWEVRAIGDFDGDRKADLVWRNTATGENLEWLMDGLSVQMATFLTSVGDLSWTIAPDR